MNAKGRAIDQATGRTFGKAIQLGKAIRLSSGILLNSSLAMALLSAAAIAQEPPARQTPTLSQEAVKEPVQEPIQEIETPLEISPEEVLTEPLPETPPEPPETRPYAPLRQSVTCPSDVAILTNLMMRDIPNYTNRVLQRTVAVLPHTEADALRAADGQYVRAPYRPSHVLIAGNVNLTPIDLSDYAFTTDPEAGGPLNQVFFTTLSRHYSGLQTKEVQAYHWLFLTEATDGWRLAFMFSQIDGSQIENTSTPPEESSRGSVGQAVQLWLRDCRAGAIAPLEETLPAPERPQRGSRPEQSSAGRELRS